MGGSIKVAVRFPNGEVITNSRWTNPLPYWIRHPRLIASDEEFLRTYANQTTEDETDRRLAPVEYGLVVIDMITKTVFSMNSYSHFGDTVLFDLASMEERFGLEENEPNGWAFRTLLADGRFSIHLNPKGKKVDPAETIVIPLRCEPNEFDITTKGFRIDDLQDTGKFYCKIGIDYGPWKIAHLGERNIPGMRDALTQAGFVFTPEDETGWVEWAKRFDEDEDEDEG